MKRILVFIFTPTYGGPHNQVYQLFKILKDKGYLTTVVLPRSKNKNEYIKLKELGIKVIEEDLKRLRGLKKIKDNVGYFLEFTQQLKLFKKLIVEQKADVVQICGLLHFGPAIIAKRMKIPIVWQILGTFAPVFLRFILTPIMSKYSTVVMSAGFKVAQLHPFHRHFLKKLIVFYPPVNLNLFNKNEIIRAKIRDELDFSPQQIIIGTVGNLNKTKGHEYFVEIAKYFKTEKNIKFVIVGGYTSSHAKYYQAKVINKAKKYELLNNNLFFIDNNKYAIYEVLNIFDIFLLTSVIEGAPTVLLEAISMGLPLISTNVGAVSEIIKHGENGFIYELNNLNDAVKYIKILINEKEIRKKMQAKNLELKENYSVFECANKHISAYNFGSLQ